MYTNLTKCLKQKGISVNAAATIIGMPEATFRTKLAGRGFYFDEAMHLREEIFPEYDLSYLFCRDEAVTEQEA